MSDNLDKIITNVIEAEKNGVKIIIKQQYDREINDINIDFSEHDKVFNDKITEFKKDYKTASELIGKYQQENEALKKRIIELENFSCQAEQETESLVEKLKQRIAELENENKNLNIRIFQNEAYGDKKPTKLNLNERVKVKLTPLGAEIYYHQCDDVNKKIKENGGTELEPIMPQIDKDGYTEFQLWHFIELYGQHIGICKPNVIEPLDIVYCGNDKYNSDHAE